jgi:hypothetical protein
MQMGRRPATGGFSRPEVRLLVILQILICAAVAARSDKPYIGEWSNGRGETLTITAKTIRFADDRPLPYRDVTRATDGTSFELQITARGEVNAFPGKTLAVSVERETMKMTGYLSHADYMQERNPQQSVTWERDSDH